MAPAKRAFDLNTLSTTIPNVFDQVQTSVATHKKNCVALFKLHDAAATVTELVNKGRKSETMLIGEKTFATVMLDMLNRVLAVKRGIQTADRIIRFIASYVKFLNEKSSSSIDPLFAC